MSERRIYLTDMDYKRLSGILRTLKNSVTGKGPQIDALAADVNNAVVVSPEDMPANVVTMNSTVRFIDLSSEEEKTCTIVFPADADIEKGRGLQHLYIDDITTLINIEDGVDAAMETFKEAQLTVV